MKQGRATRSTAIPAVEGAENGAIVARFEWDPKRDAAALALAEGKTIPEAAKESGLSARTINRLKQDPEFNAEVDRLSLMVAIASRAERLRIAQRVARQKTAADGTIDTNRDILEWLKYVQSETDGANLNLAFLAEALERASDQ